MTKLREPGSLKDALFIAIGLLGDEVCEASTGLSRVHLRACSDPDGEKRLSADALLALEAALVRHGHPALFSDVIRRELATLGAAADALGLTVDPLKRLGVLAEQFGALAGSINHAADDDRLSPAERRDILRCAVTLEKAVHTLIAGLRPPPATATTARAGRTR